jgi:hypothetical protein
MILTINTDSYLLFAMLFMQLRGSDNRIILRVPLRPNPVSCMRPVRTLGIFQMPSHARVIFELPSIPENHFFYKALRLP